MDENREHKTQEAVRLGPSWLGRSGWASGNVTSVLSFSDITSTRPEIAGSNRLQIQWLFKPNSHRGYRRGSGVPSRKRVCILGIEGLMALHVYRLKYRSGFFSLVVGALSGALTLIVLIMLTNANGQLAVRDQLSGMPTSAQELVFSWTLLQLPIPVVFLVFLSAGIVGTTWCWGVAAAAFRGKNQLIMESEGVSQDRMFGSGSKFLTWAQIQSIALPRTGVLLIQGRNSSKRLMIVAAIPKQEVPEVKRVLIQFIPGFAENL
jgi:hypothetical protein